MERLYCSNLCWKFGWIWNNWKGCFI